MWMHILARFVRDVLIRLQNLELAKHSAHYGFTKLLFNCMVLLSLVGDGRAVGSPGAASGQRSILLVLLKLQEHTVTAI
jgi:hypothetical protein